MYEGSLDVEELIDWISAMNKYFEYENVANGKKVNFVVTRLKVHASLGGMEYKMKGFNKEIPRLTVETEC